MGKIAGLAGIILSFVVAGSVSANAVAGKKDIKGKIDSELAELFAKKGSYGMTPYSCNGRALKYFEESNMNAAERMLDFCIEKFPDEGRTYLNHAVACFANGNYGKAKDSAMKFLDNMDFTPYYLLEKDSQKMILATAYHILAAVEYEEGRRKQDNKKLQSALHYLLVEYLLTPEDNAQNAIVQMKDALQLKEAALAAEVAAAEQIIKNKIWDFSMPFSVSEIIRTIEDYRK